MERRKIRAQCVFIELKNNKLRYKCKECKIIWLKPVNGLIKNFPSLYQFFNRDKKFVLLLRKGVYPYECMDSWERFD